MSEHILISKAKSYNVHNSLSIEGYSFNNKIGFWQNNITSEALMLSNDIRKPSTKKEDIETGEDQKGE